LTNSKRFQVLYSAILEKETFDYCFNLGSWKVPYGLNTEKQRKPKKYRSGVLVPNRRISLRLLISFKELHNSFFFFAPFASRCNSLAHQYVGALNVHNYD
jgi:hypothetical protein